MVSVTVYSYVVKLGEWSRTGEATERLDISVWDASV